MRLARLPQAPASAPGARLPWRGQGEAFTVWSSLGLTAGRFPPSLERPPWPWRESPEGRARSWAAVFCVESQAALKKYQTEQRNKGDALDKCQAELKKLRKKSQGSKNPQKYSDKELQVGWAARATRGARAAPSGDSSSAPGLLALAAGSEGGCPVHKQHSPPVCHRGLRSAPLDGVGQSQVCCPGRFWGQQCPVSRSWQDSRCGPGVPYPALTASVGCWIALHQENRNPDGTFPPRPS